MSKKLPVKLQINVLVDVVFEMRFDAQQGFSDLIPGGARALFGPVRRVEKTPIAELPHQMRELDPGLKYQPTMRMVWDEVVLVIGEHGIGIGYGEKYPGWATFKNHITKLLDWISENELSGMIQKVNRYALKYVDFISNEYSEGISCPYQVSVSVGGESMDENPLKLQFEKKESFGTALFEFSSPVHTQIENRPPQMGTVISIDTVRFLHSGLSWEAFRKDIGEHIEPIHQKNKEYFFSVLSAEVLNKLEPSYE